MFRVATVHLIFIIHFIYDNLKSKMFCFCLQIAARIVDIFEVEPTRLNVPSYGHKFVVVRFTPPTMQTYQCLFEAIVEATSGYAIIEQKLHSVASAKMPG